MSDTQEQVQIEPTTKTSEQTEVQQIQVDTYKLAMSQKTSFMDPVMWMQMKQMAKTFIKSQALPEWVKNEDQAIIALQAGMEMGMLPMETFKSLYMIKGVLTIYGAAVGRRLRTHGWSVTYIDEPNKCTATIKKGDEEFTDTLTFEEAEKSKWTRSSGAQSTLKAGWYEGVNRKLKLRYGVTSLLIKTYVPEVLGSATDIAEVAMDMSQTIQDGEKMSLIPPSEKDSNPATEAQLTTIKSLGGEVTEEMTFGDASQLIARLSIKK